MLTGDVCVEQALPGQTTPDNCPSFKLILVGDGGTGRVSSRLPEVWGHIGCGGTYSDASIRRSCREDHLR